MTATGPTRPRPGPAKPSAPARRRSPTKPSPSCISRVGPNARQLDSEIEKVALYVGDRQEIEFEDVETICTATRPRAPSPSATPWATATCPACWRCLDEALWEVKLDPQKSEIGLLYGLICKVRAMLLLKEMLREGWVKPDMDYNRFKAQLERVPADQLPEDRRFNPLRDQPLCALQGPAPGQALQPGRTDSRDGPAVPVQPSPRLQQPG